MTWTTAMVWALGRAAAVALIASAAGGPLANLIRAQTRGPSRNLLLILVAAPLITPPLLVGYAYSNFSLALVRHPLLNELLYAALLLLKLVPIAIAIRLLAPPPPLSPQAAHVARLMPDSMGASIRAWRHRLSLALSGRLRTMAVCFTAVFLLAFGDFELASLMSMTSGTQPTAQTWTVWLFDAQVGGLTLGESLAAAAWPAAAQAAVLILAALMLLRGRGPAHTQKPAQSSRGSMRVAMWAYVVIALIVISVIPLGVVGGGTVRGLGQLLEQFPIGRELAAGAAFATIAAGAAMLISRWPIGSGRGRVILAIGLCAPGLFGSLLLGLVVLAIFQVWPLTVAYDTPLPLLIALTFLILPLAVLLRWLIDSVESSTAAHTAVMMSRSSDRSVRRAASALWWRSRGSKLAAIATLLFLWAYFDVAATAILSPSGVTAVSVRLYNLMHYGRSAVLSAMVCVMVLTPIILVAIAAATHAAYQRWIAHE